MTPDLVASIAREIAEQYMKARTLGESRPYKSLAEHIAAGLSLALKDQQEQKVELQRWQVFGDNDNCCMVDPVGEWVRWADVAALLEKFNV